jgi:uncharacterized protein (DUF885 family)
VWSGLFRVELSAQTVDGANNGGRRAAAKAAEVFDLGELKSPDSEMRRMIERYTLDRSILARSHPVLFSESRRARFRQFYTEWSDLLTKLDFDRLSHDDKIDYLLFKNHLDYELRQSEIQAGQLAEIEPLVPFAKSIAAMEEARRRMEPINSAKTAVFLTELKNRVDETRKAVEAGLTRERRSESQPSASGQNQPNPIKAKKTVANRAVATVNSLRTTLRNWYNFYNGYDPVFSWWTQEPYRVLELALGNYASFLSERVVGLKPDATPAPQGDQRAPTGGGPAAQRGGPQRPGGAGARPGDSSDIVGDPIGREALLSELRSEMIPYTPEELITIAEKEMAWCETEMKKASQALGYGDDWHKALEYVKTLYVEPGKQPELIRELALEAIKFVTDHDLVTVPELARDSWRMEMMTPERQLVSPFFLGGEVIQVSYPTNTMAHEQKMMSMRGNNIHFARATVHHELIPGHHLQGFMTARYKPYRGLFSTPFWGEGWALYWELLLWDMKFGKTPENRIGMLFWRMHRCARIIFSLSFHLEKMTPQQCIDFLVSRVGHEVDNATAEVRRSFDGSYGPLYQVAYLLGGLQLYSLHRELVDSGKMNNRTFHDWILKENRIPIEMVRAILTRQKLTRDFKSAWRFYRLDPAAD